MSFSYKSFCFMPKSFSQIAFGWQESFFCFGYLANWHLANTYLTDITVSSLLVKNNLVNWHLANTYLTDITVSSLSVKHHFVDRHLADWYSIETVYGRHFNDPVIWSTRLSTKFVSAKYFSTKNRVTYSTAVIEEAKTQRGATSIKLFTVVIDTAVCHCQPLPP